MNPYHDHDKHPVNVPTSFGSAVLIGVMLFALCLLPAALFVVVRWLVSLI